MRLLNDATSPFGRKVMMAALSRHVPVIEEFVDPNAPEQIWPFNPLGQIPVLILKGGRSLFDSRTIMMHLDDCHAGPRLFPPDRRDEILTAVSLCDGVMEAILQRLLETRKPAPQQSREFIVKLEQRILRGVKAIDGISLTPPADNALLASDVAAIAALGYCDFRYETGWRSECPRLSEWYAANADRALVRATAPTRKVPASLG